jgi:hypothetical protein
MRNDGRGHAVRTPRPFVGGGTELGDNSHTDRQEITNTMRRNHDPRGQAPSVPLARTSPPRWSQSDEDLGLIGPNAVRQIGMAMVYHTLMNKMWTAT